MEILFGSGRYAESPQAPAAAPRASGIAGRRVAIMQIYVQGPVPERHKML